jgi:hypothetical protein
MSEIQGLEKDLPCLDGWLVLWTLQVLIFFQGMAVVAVIIW